MQSLSYGATNGFSTWAAVTEPLLRNLPILCLQVEWNGSFDFVFESYTLQVLPADIRRKAIARISDLVAQGGKLLVITRGRESSDPEGNMPWPLTRVRSRSFRTLQYEGSFV